MTWYWYIPVFAAWCAVSGLYWWGLDKPGIIARISGWFR